MLPNYTILTKKSVLDIPYDFDEQFQAECEMLVNEQDEILLERYSFFKQYNIHFIIICRRNAGIIVGKDIIRTLNIKILIIDVTQTVQIYFGSPVFDSVDNENCRENQNKD